MNPQQLQPAMGGTNTVRRLCTVAVLLAGCATAPRAAVDPVTMPASAQESAWVRLIGPELDGPLDDALADLAAALDEETDLLPAYIDVPPVRPVLPPVAATVPVTDPALARDGLLGHGEFVAMLQHQHPLVEQWIAYFTTGKGRDQYLRFLGRMHEYGDELAVWLREEGVPPELVWLSFIESGVNPRAYSRAHAAGMWQFIASTGRLYGLKRDFWIDERRDPERSTRAAARHLSDLYNDFGAWELALSAYNAGARRISGAARRVGHRDFWRMVHQHKALPRETRNYVPKLIAAYRIGQDPQAYGFAPSELTATTATTSSWRTVAIPHSVTLKAVAAQLGVDLGTLSILNLHLRRGITPPPGTHRSFVNVPVAWAPQLEQLVAANALKSEPWGAVHVVRNGDTLWDIARHYDTTVTELMSLNGLRGKTLRIGQELVVPGAASRGAVALTSARDGHVTVRRGDTLSAIAMRHGVTVSALKGENDLTGETIRAGQVLRLPTAPLSGDADPVRYRVRSGDTLWRIAQRYGVSVEAVRRLNNLRDSAIKAGDVLLIPGRVS